MLFLNEVSIQATAYHVATRLLATWSRDQLATWLTGDPIQLPKEDRRWILGYFNAYSASDQIVLMSYIRTILWSKLYGSHN